MEAEGFDLDEVIEADLEMPARPAPLYDLDALDALLRRPGLLPPGTELKALDEREYQLSMPGIERPLRITTSREFFEEHPASSELWSPGSPLFPALDDALTREEVEALGADLLTATPHS